MLCCACHSRRHSSAAQQQPCCLACSFAAFLNLRIAPVHCIHACVTDTDIDPLDADSTVAAPVLSSVTDGLYDDELDAKLAKKLVRYSRKNTRTWPTSNSSAVAAAAECTPDIALPCSQLITIVLLVVCSLLSRLSSERSSIRKNVATTDVESLTAKFGGRRVSRAELAKQHEHELQDSEEDVSEQSDAGAEFNESEGEQDDDEDAELEGEDAEDESQDGEDDEQVDGDMDNGADMSYSDDDEDTQQLGSDEEQAEDDEEGTGRCCLKLRLCSTTPLLG